jgi:tetratricopeptide (TPR) repeat protein
VHLAGVRDGMLRIYAASQIAKGNATPRERFRAILDAGDKEAGPAFAGSPKEEAAVREHLGHGYWELGESASAEAQFKRILALREADGAPLAETTRLRIQLARVCADSPGQRFADAERYLDAATLNAVRGSGDKLLLAETLRALGTIKLMSDPGAAVKLLEEARGSLAGVPNAGEMVDAVDDSLAASYLAGRDPERALALYTGIYNRMRQRHGDRHLETATRLDSVADCEFMLKKHDEALAHYQQVHEVYQRLLIAPDTRLINSLRQLEAVHRAKGDAPAAAAFKDRADTMARDMEQSAPRR